MVLGKAKPDKDWALGTIGVGWHGLPALELRATHPPPLTLCGGTAQPLSSWVGMMSQTPWQARLTFLPSSSLPRPLRSPSTRCAGRSSRAMKATATPSSTPTQLPYNEKWEFPRNNLQFGERGSLHPPRPPCHRARSGWRGAAGP